ncbi:spindle assembly abnormal protein 6 homolog isoform X2 [Festucalex cinctus]
MEAIFSDVVKVIILCRHCDERKAHIRVTIELQSSTSSVRKQDLVVRLTNDSDPHFFFSLTISEEDFQSLKVQQNLLIEFASFPEMLTQLLEQCRSEQNCSHPRFHLLLSCDSTSLDGPAHLSVMETSSFKHINQLSLRLTPGSDKHVRDYLAACLASVKAEKEALEVKLQKTENDLGRRLKNAEQTLSEKTNEMERLRSEWNRQSSSLSGRHADELRSEREKAAEERLRQQMQQLRQDVESAHQRSSQQMQNRLAQLETSCAELSDSNYKHEAAVRELTSKLASAEEECQRANQQVASLRRENATLDAALHDKQRLAKQLQARVVALEQEAKDLEHNMSRTQEALKAAQQQKDSIKENADGKDAQLRQLRGEVEFLSADVQKGNDIIRKFQCDLQVQLDKNRDKNAALVAQEKVVRETSAKLERCQKEVRDARRQLHDKDREVASLKEQLESSVQKLSETKELLQNNENVIGWLNKQLNEKQLAVEKFPEPAGLQHAHFYPHVTKAAATSPDVLHKHVAGDGAGGLDAKYFRRRDGSIPVHDALLPRELPPARSKLPVPSAYFPG